MSAQFRSKKCFEGSEIEPLLLEMKSKKAVYRIRKHALVKFEYVICVMRLCAVSDLACTITWWPSMMPYYTDAWYLTTTMWVMVYKTQGRGLTKFIAVLEQNQRRLLKVGIWIGIDTTESLFDTTKLFDLPFKVILK